MTRDELAAVSAQEQISGAFCCAQFLANEMPCLF
jgi:hypothetical protein